jgi:dolichol-phosphate mannosyltransferase
MKNMSNDKGFSGIVVIIPTLNEEKGIGSTILELQKTLKDTHYIVVDGNSVDNTVKIATKLDAEVIQQDGIGKGQAIANALKYIKLKTRYVVFIDADFTYPADCVYRMIKILDNNQDVGMVTGNRFNSHYNLRAMNNIFYVGNRIIAMIQLWLNGIQLRDPLTGLRVVRWEILKTWEPKSEGFDIEVELNYYVFKKLRRIVEIPICYRERLGKKKLSFKHGFTILKRILIQTLT